MINLTLVMIALFVGITFSKIIFHRRSFINQMSLSFGFIILAVLFWPNFPDIIGEIVYPLTGNMSVIEGQSGTVFDTPIHDAPKSDYVDLKSTITNKKSTTEDSGSWWVYIFFIPLWIYIIFFQWGYKGKLKDLWTGYVSLFKKKEKKLYKIKRKK